MDPNVGDMDWEKGGSPRDSESQVNSLIKLKGIFCVQCCLTDGCNILTGFLHPDLSSLLLFHSITPILTSLIRTDCPNRPVPSKQSTEYALSLYIITLRDLYASLSHSSIVESSKFHL